MKIVMLGAPGAGKGTQAAKLSLQYAIPQISTGKIFRDHIKNQTTLGKNIEEFINKGLFVPDELTLDVVLNRIRKEDCLNGYILDGFPRNIQQAIALKENQGEMDFVLNISVQDELIIDRMKYRRFCPSCGRNYHMLHLPPKKENICDYCGHELTIRKDDKEETVKRRLLVYHEQTQPLIEYYQKQNLLFTIDGTQKVQDVFDHLLALIGE
ncbi:adenylate kinase [Clostridia bacterium]|nr:adenylate kinase [Clostridia bacterium]